MTMPELVLLLDDIETARAMGVSTEELESLVAAGHLPAVYIHGKRRFLREDVEALARTRRS